MTDPNPSSKGEARHHQIWFLPWADLPDNLSLGAVTFRKWKPALLEDAAVASHIGEILSCYIDDGGESVRSVNIACVDGKVTEALTDAEEAHLRQVVDVLIFALVGSSKAFAIESSWNGPANADLYALVGQNFQAGDYQVAERSGNLLSVHRDFRLLKHRMPGRWSFAHTDFDVARTVGGIFSRRFPKADRVRFLRSFEWFRLAQTNRPEVDYKSKVVMLATAFEILLGLPESEKARQFASRLSALLGGNNTGRTTRQWTTRGNKKRERCTVLYSWAHRFYSLRSKIVHGDEVSLSSAAYRTWDFLTIGEVLFYHTVLRMLSERGLQTKRMAEIVALWDEGFPGWRSGLDASELYFQEGGLHSLYATLGWSKNRKQAT